MTHAKCTGILLYFTLYVEHGKKEALFDVDNAKL